MERGNRNGMSDGELRIIKSLNNKHRNRKRKKKEPNIKRDVFFSFRKTQVNCEMLMETPSQGECEKMNSKIGMYSRMLVFVNIGIERV